MLHVTPQAETISRRLANFAHELTFDMIPKETVWRAKHLILDAMGVAFASSRMAFAGRILHGLEALGEGGSQPVIGLDATLTTRNAVLMNAALVHGIDYDDTHMQGLVHATAMCAPLALNVARESGASGRDALVAYVAGMEAAIRMGMAMNGGLHAAGFHPTGILAHFSACLVAGRLYGLTVEEMATAQGIAASTAAASQVYLEEGAWSKRLHPGWGGVGGITAARLAQNGFVGPSRPYEGRYGFFESHLQHRIERADYGTLTATLGKVWELQNTAIKPYPICAFLHGCVEAAEELAISQAFALADIARVIAIVPQETISVIAEPAAKKRRPVTDYEAKFSAQFVIAACLVRGRFGMAELEPASLLDDAILSLAERVEYAPETETVFPTYYSGGVVVVTADGKRHERYHRVNKGAGHRALSNIEIVDKFDATVSKVLSGERSKLVRDAILTLEEREMDEIWKALATNG
jgi:2-methylcitrate dehydratase PrpD